MDRKDFITNCSLTCLGLIGMSLMLDSCTPIYYAQSTASEKKLTLAKTEFEISKGGKIKYRNYVVVKTDKADFPIIVYREKNQTYTSLELRCTHQGNELNIHGDLLSCPAHGSEFSRDGKILQGPAEQELKKFTTTSDEKYIYIELI